MQSLFQPLLELQEFEEIQKNIEKDEMPVHVTGCFDSQKCQFMAALGQTYTYKVILAENELKAKEIYEDFKLYDREVYLYPAKDAIFYHADVHGNAIVRQRLQVLRCLYEKRPAVIVTTLDGGMDKLLPLEFWVAHIFMVKEGDILDLEQLKKRLVNMGYEYVTQVDAS